MTQAAKEEASGSGTVGRDWELGLYASMLFVRLVEESIAQRYSSNEMRCPVHLSVGQEAAAVGTTAPLSPDDLVFSTHRCHAHYLAKGGDLAGMLGEIYGRRVGCVGGRGGSMHLMDKDKGIYASVPIVGSSIPLAVGAALSQHMDGSDRVSVAYLGDAATEEGVFHESANFAVLYDLPVIFVIENNLYSVYTPLHRRQPRRPLADLALAHGMASRTEDGNDVLAVASAMREAVERGRAGAGPTLLCLDTYRWREHCGPNYDNDLGYRSVEEFETWKARDPVARHFEGLVARGWLDAEADSSLRKTIQDRIDHVFEEVISSPLPEADEANAKVYAS